MEEKLFPGTLKIRYPNGSVKYQALMVTVSLGYEILWETWGEPFKAKEGDSEFLAYKNILAIATEYGWIAAPYEGKYKHLFPGEKYK